MKCFVLQDDKGAGDADGGVVNGVEPIDQSSEPYRRMLPGLIPLKEDAEDTPTTPRKRLMNFKIPFVRQRRDVVMIARRRLHDDRRKRRRHEEEGKEVFVLFNV